MSSPTIVAKLDLPSVGVRVTRLRHGGDSKHDKFILESLEHDARGERYWNQVHAITHEGPWYPVLCALLPEGTGL